MTTTSTTPTTSALSLASSSEQTRRPLLRAGITWGVVGAAAATAFAAISRAFHVPLSVAGESIPLYAFAQLTLISVLFGTAIAAGLRRIARRPRRGVWVALGTLTAASIAPDLAVDASLATRVVLATIHLVAAAIIIPQLARAVPPARDKPTVRLDQAI